MIKDLALAHSRRGNQMRIEHEENVVANICELCFNFLAVAPNLDHLAVVALGLFLLLDRRNYTPRGAAGTNDILVGNREEIALFDGKLLVTSGNFLHVIDHLCKRREHLASCVNKVNTR